VASSASSIGRTGGPRYWRFHPTKMWRRTSSAAAQVPARRPEEDVGRWLHSLGHARSHRLEAEDTTLSRWRHGFKSRWDYNANVLVTGQDRDEFRHEQATSCPLIP